MNQELIHSIPPNPLESIRQLVLHATPSPLTRIAYGHAIDEYFAWWTSEGRPAFTRPTVQRYRAHLQEGRGLAPASINQRLSALRKLAKEAVYAGQLDPPRRSGDPRRSRCQDAWRPQRKLAQQESG